MGEGREGDWECGGCRNRNYAFRYLCKQPRLLVDTKTPADSKWLPRIGDWICTGCSNNNYASREICKKCGQPKEKAAISAIAGSSLPEYEHYFSRVQGLPGLKMNFQIAGNSTIQESLLPHPDCSFGGPAKHGLQPNPTWPFNGTSITGYSHSANAFVVPEGWRNGDWICKCGFHNYSSRSQGAKQWCDGDWMCSQCDNHNFASRSHCNRCKTPKEPPTRSGSAS